MFLLYKNGVSYTFNNCTVTTKQDQGVVTFECLGVTGDGTQQQKDSLKSLINQACEIFNDITYFKPSDYQSSDKLHMEDGGKFYARINSSYNGIYGGTSDMIFPSIGTNLGIVVHEMAHNLMHQINIEQDIQFQYQNLVRNVMIKFMEFATHAEGAQWKWLNAHNYPVISSCRYNIIGNYLVAAACQISVDMLSIEVN